MSIEKQKADWPTSPKWATQFGISDNSVGALLWCNDIHYLYVDPRYDHDDHDDQSPYEFGINGTLSRDQVRILECRIDETDYTPENTKPRWPENRQPVVGDPATYNDGERNFTCVIKYVSQHHVLIESMTDGGEWCLANGFWQQVLKPQRPRAHHEIDTMINLVDAGGLNRGQYAFLEYFCEVLIENGYGARLTREEVVTLVRSKLISVLDNQIAIHPDNFLDYTTIEIVKVLGYDVSGLSQANGH